VTTGTIKGAEVGFQILKFKRNIQHVTPLVSANTFSQESMYSHIHMYRVYIYYARVTQWKKVK